MTIAHPASFRSVDAIGFMGLFLPGKQRQYMNYTILGGQALPIGSVMGMVTASGKLVLAKASAGDGSQVPFAVMAETVNTTDQNGNALDMSMSVIVGGYLNAAALVVDPSFAATMPAVLNQLRVTGILTDTPNYSG